MRRGFSPHLIFWGDIWSAIGYAMSDRLVAGFMADLVMKPAFLRWVVAPFLVVIEFFLGFLQI